MQRRLQKFLPIFLIALAVQILAPIAASWAAAIAASDPLGATELCLHEPGQLPASGDHGLHDGLCSICCTTQAGISLESPQPLVAANPLRQHARVVWRDFAPEFGAVRTGSNAQARAPPQLT
jgi:DUF2946 family protein